MQSQVLYDKENIKDSHRILYEWVEDTISDTVSINAKEVREQAPTLLDASFGKYEKFQKLGKRMKKVLGLRCIGKNGKASVWVKK